MTDITALAEIAPDLTSLTVVNSTNNIGLHINLGKTLTGTPIRTELWWNHTNDRASAALQDVVLGKYYFFPGRPNRTYYFWARNISEAGAINGNWYPAGATSGVSGTAGEISNTVTCDFNTELVGNNTFQLVGSILINNPVAQNILVSLHMQAMQKYTGNADCTWELRSQVGPAGTAPSGTETVVRTWDTITNQQQNVSFIGQKLPLTTTQARLFKFYWKGANSNVHLIQPQCYETHNFNDPEN